MQKSYFSEFGFLANFHEKKEIQLTFKAHGFYVLWRDLLLMRKVMRKVKPGPNRAQARAQAGPKPGPSWAQAVPKPEFWKFENLGPRNLEIWDPKKSKNTNSQNQNPCRLKCRQGLDSRKKSSWPHLAPSGVNFSMDRKNAKTSASFAYFPWWAR